MASGYSSEDVDAARVIRAEIEEQGRFIRPYGEFRKRIAAAGISLSSTACSKLWKAAAEKEVITEEDPGGEEEEQEEQEDADEQGLTLIELKLSCLTPIREEKRSMTTRSV